MRTVRDDDDDYDGFWTADDDEAPAGEYVEADIFGQAVHRLCEVRPPRETWPEFIDQVAAAERRPGEPVEHIPEFVTTEIETAAASALGYVNTLHDKVGPQATYDEFPISLAVDSIELEGYIDHLVVTANTYYVVDYKTSRQREGESIQEFLDRQKEHHEPQVLAYAAALLQADQTRNVAAQLYFTDVDDVVRWSPDELVSARTRVQEIINESLQEALAEKPIQLI